MAISKKARSFKLKFSEFSENFVKGLSKKDNIS